MTTFYFFAATLFYACHKEVKQKDSANYIKNDLECYDGWIGANVYPLDTVDAHSGTHSFETKPVTAIYSITFSKKLSELSKTPVKKFKVSLWVKTADAGAKGSYVLSIEKGPNTLAYFSFDLPAPAKTNEWFQITGDADIPRAFDADAIVKIYFWNKGQSSIRIDDFEISFEN